MDLGSDAVAARVVHEDCRITCERQKAEETMGKRQGRGDKGEVTRQKEEPRTSQKHRKGHLVRRRH